MQEVRGSILGCILVLFTASVVAQTECPPFYIFTGDADSSFFGSSVASAGDVNNDGYADVIIGSVFDDAVGTRAGRAFVLSGKNGQTLYVLSAENQFDRFGASVASAGDVNNDGYDDVIVGAWANDAGGRDAGRVYVFSGRNGDTLHIFTGEENDDWFGFSVASAGDVNNDGYSDMVVGAMHNSGGSFHSGRAYVFSGFSGNTLHVFTGEAENDQFGNSVASAGDVNGDGYADLIVGAVFNDAAALQSGRAYVFSGSNGDTLFVFNGEEPFDRFGLSVASAGDVDGDGYDDLIIGAPRADASGFDFGRAYVFSGKNGDTIYVFTGQTAGEELGGSVASAGDTNNDGSDDLIVGASRKGHGRAYVFSGLSGEKLYIYTGESNRDGFGNSVASAGDVNRDGYADLVVGAIFNDAGGEDAGRAYVFLGADVRCGDVNNDGAITQDDLAFMIEFYFLAGEPPVLCGADDVNNDSVFDLSDIIYLAEYLNGIGPAPCANGTPPPLFDPKRKPEERQSGSSGY